MDFLSVCSGFGGAELAWEPLGWVCRGIAEIDPAARAVLKHHWPGVKNHGDFTKIGADDGGTVDVVVGGTPCQSFSVAGLRGGLGDERGNLALEFLRLVDRKRPRWVVWENVPGVYSATSHVAPDPRPPAIDLDGDNGPEDGEEIVVEDEYDADEDHAFACFLAGLSELGYEYAYRTLDAQHFGVPQRRRRVFVVGYLGDWRCAAAALFERHCLSGHTPPRREARQGTAAGVEVGPSGGRLTDIAPTIDAGCKDGFIRNQLGVGVLSSTDEVSHCLNAGGMGRQDFESETMIAHALSADGFDASEDGTGRGTPLVPVAAHMTGAGFWQEGFGTLRAREQDSHENLVAFRAAGQDGFTPSEISPPVTGTDGGGAGVPTICFDSRQDPCEYGDRSGALGVSSPQSMAVAFVQNHRDEARLFGEDGQTVGALPAEPGMKQQCYIAQEELVAFNLRGREGGSMAEMAEMAEMASVRAASGGSSRTYVAPQMAVRRLTPTECERLQGLPDNWTLVPYHGAPMKDAPRYKMIGNGFAIPCVSWIGSRIQMVEDLKP